MNANRRKQIQEIIGQISGLRSKLEDLQSEEQEAFDNMPEGLQQSDKGQASEAAADKLSEAVSSCEEIESALEEACE